MSYESVSCWGVRNNQWVLRHVPDHLKIQERCERVTEKYWYELVPDHLKTREICEGAVEKYPYPLKYVSDNFKTQEMFDRAVRDDPSSMRFVPDWFVTHQLKIWHDDGCYCNDDKLIKWYNGYKKRKAQKAQI